MKNLTAVLLLLAVALTVGVDAGRSKKHRASVRENDGDNHVDDIPDLPSPEEIHSFDVPEEFINGGSHDTDEGNDAGRNNHKSHGKGRRHG